MKRPSVLEKKIKFTKPVIGQVLFLIKQILHQAIQVWHVELFFRTLLSSICFSHEFLVHVHENVSFEHVAFLHLIRYGNLCKCFNLAKVCLAICKSWNKVLRNRMRGMHGISMGIPGIRVEMMGMQGIRVVVQRIRVG